MFHSVEFPPVAVILAPFTIKLPPTVNDIPVAVEVAPAKIPPDKGK